MRIALAARAMAFVLVVATGLIEIALAGESESQAQDFEALLTRARSTVDSGRLDDAERLYRKALCLKPGHAVARFELGSCYMDMGRSYDARRSFRLALSARAGDEGWEGRCRLAIARTWEESHDWKQALHEYELALAADSTLTEARAATERLRAEVD